MRRHPSRSALLLGSAAAALVVGFTLGPAAVALAAEPSPTTSAGAGGGTGAATGPKVGPPTPGVAGCALPAALKNVTGMVATDKGIFVVEGGDTDQVTFHLLDANCKAELNIFSGANPLNPQDLAMASDGAVVVADIGDTDESAPSRARIAIETAQPDGNTAKTFRFQYPGGAKFDAQAMVLDKGDVPIVFAHEANGATGIYKPTKALEAEITENLPQLAKIGTFTPANTNTPNPKGAAGNTLVTGAAKAPDGKHVVVRTLSDAYEYTVEDGDVAKALTTTPVVTPLPNEPDGQAITYSADGTKFITVSVGAGATLMTWTRYVPPPPATEQAAQPADTAGDDSGGLLSKLSFNEMTRIIAAVGVVGLVLAIAGIIGIRRARRRRREEEEYDDYDDYDDDPRPRRGRGRGRDDDHGYGVREPAYSAGYDDQGGYGADQYGAAGGYAANGYGAGQYADQYGAAGYAEPGYVDPAYGGQQYADTGYGAQGYGADQYGGQQQYGADQYGGQQQYGDYGQGQYGGYGYEEDFDPMQDPRRR